jgi:hypothetical protein
MGALQSRPHTATIPDMAAYALFSRDALIWDEQASDGTEAIVVTDGERVQVLAEPAAAAILTSTPFTPSPADPEAVLGQIARRFSSYYHVEGHQEPGTLEEVVAELQERYPYLPVSR